MKNKGITLISLIITVIIMIILASVTVNLITEGGIIEKTKEATNDYQYQMEKEEFELAIAASKDYVTQEINEDELYGLLEGWTVTFENSTIKAVSPNENEFKVSSIISEDIDDKEEDDDETFICLVSQEEIEGTLMYIVDEKIYANYGEEFWWSTIRDEEDTDKSTVEGTIEDIKTSILGEDYEEGKEITAHVAFGSLLLFKYDGDWYAYKGGRDGYIIKFEETTTIAPEFFDSATEFILD